MVSRLHTGIAYTGELLDWGFDWTDVIPAGDSIYTSTWIVSDGLFVAKETVEGNVAACWIGGYQAAELYEMTNRVVLAPSNRTMDQTITLYCLDAGSGGAVLHDAVDTDGNVMVWSDGSYWKWLEVE